MSGTTKKTFEIDNCPDHFGGYELQVILDILRKENKNIFYPKRLRVHEVSAECKHYGMDWNEDCNLCNDTTIADGTKGIERGK